MFSESAHSDLPWTIVKGYSRKENTLFEQKHGGGMCDSSQQTKGKITTITTITPPPPPLWLLLILGREDVIVNLNPLSCYILAIGWVRVCPGMC